MGDQDQTTAPARPAGEAAVPGGLAAWRRSTLATPELAVGLERLGYATVWLGAADGDLRVAEDLLDATSTLHVATGIVNIWAYPPEAVAAAWHRVHERYGDRLLLGLGVGHPEATGDRYRRPYRAMLAYLDALDAAGVPAGARVLAALGPRTLQLSAQRAGGAHPYLVTPEHTRRAREILGSDRLLVPDHKVVLHSDAETARTIARETLARYLGMVNYRNSLRSLGFRDDDLDGEGSDRLVDAVCAWGTPDAIVRRLREHLDAGADQVAANLVTGPDDDALEGFSTIAAAWANAGA
jgi:probable F420-dependent oxidoreductase